MTTLEANDADRAAFAGRKCEIDYDQLEQLHYLGSYVRDIPVNLRRMMENAHDWEHLPFVHPSSFADIALVESGLWGWRCKTALPNNGGEQLVELLVDEPRHYWATTVVAGSGLGTQIHTQATARDQGGITVDVRFYAPEAPVTPEQGAMILGYLQTQYATLYDEDEALMLGRQEALDERKAARDASPQDQASFGVESELDRGTTHEADLGGEAILARFHGGRWIAHAARCPHALAPLADAKTDESSLTCPWHGYNFDLASGREAEERCGALSLYPCSVTESGELVATRPPSRPR